MKYKLIDIGRSKISRTVDVVSETQLLNEVGKHLMSRDIELITDDEGDTFRVYAGVRNVGTVELVREEE